MRNTVIIALSLVSLPAWTAEEGGSGGSTSSSDLKAMLDALPTIETVPAPEEQAPPEDDPLSTTRSDAYTAYAVQVERTVLAQWDPKKKLLKSQPTAVAKLIVKVDDSGQFVGVSLLESSGDDAFNKEALRAVREAARVDAPPPPEVASDLKKGVVVDFVAGSKLALKGG
jgi:TonB family protein